LNELEIYRRAFQALSEANFERAVSATLDAMVDVAHADRGFLVRMRDNDPEPTILARTTARDGDFPTQGPSRAIIARALDTRAPVRLENALETDEFRGRPSVLSISVLSVLAVPIVSPARPGTLVLKSTARRERREEAIACVYLDSVRLTGIFTEEAEKAAVELALAVAPGMRTAFLLEDAEARARSLRARLDEVESGDRTILGRSPKLLAALERAVKAAPADVPILLSGESGTGKELFARAIHHASRRAQGPFVAINCGAIPEGTLEAELFGHVKGAFTGAVQDRTGRIEAANGGTLFLDEIADMAPPLQVKLLRALQEGTIQKLGENKERPVSVRIVAATHGDLPALVREGRFREDLYYRLRVVGIEIPPLRERGDDVVLLADAFAQREGRAQGKDILGLTPAAREAVLAHQFRGNVRELENAIRHAVVFASGPRIGPGDLPAEIGRGAPVLAGPTKGIPRDAEELRAAKDDAVRRIERAFLEDLLGRADGNVSKAARIAGMNRTHLHELIAKHGMGK
jgi:transcriptional regulator with GAF, ATPase, and Fis domain